MSRFIIHHIKQLKRQWITLPFLLFFPIILVGAVALLFYSWIQPVTETPLTIAIVDNDQSEETVLLSTLLTDSNTLAEHISMIQLTTDEAKTQLAQQKIIGYLSLPTNFTETLYNGERTNIAITADPAHQNEILLLKQVVDRIANYMNLAQANLLLINETAHALHYTDETRISLIKTHLLSYFTRFFAKEQFMPHEEVENIATANPVNYYMLSVIFSLLIIWIFLLQQWLLKETPQSITWRLRLYNVGLIKPLLAKGALCLLIPLPLATLFIYIMRAYAQLYWLPSDYVKIFVLLLCVTLIFCCHLLCIELLCQPKRAMPLQLVYTLYIIISSGAILPSAYLPIRMPSYSQQAFEQLSQVILYERTYAEFLPLLSTLLVSIFLGFMLLKWKERTL